MKNFTQYLLSYLLGAGNEIFRWFSLHSFAVPKDVELNTTHFFIMKIPNKWEFQQTAINHSSDTDSDTDFDE